MDSRSVMIFLSGLLIVVLALFTNGVFSLKCYECNSLLVNNCFDPFDNKTHKIGECLTSTRERRLAHYAIHNDRRVLRNEYPVCRKTVLKVEDDYRIIRDCAWLVDEVIVHENGTREPKLESWPCIDRAGTWHIKQRVCHCTTDGCNSSSQNVLSLTLIGLGLLLPLLYL